VANTIELVHPSVHSSPQPKRQTDRFSCFVQLTAESPYIVCNGRPYLPNLSLPMGIWTSISDIIPWAHPSPQPKRHLDRFVYVGLRAKTDEAIEVPFGLYFTMVCPFPPQNYLFQCRIWTSEKCDSRQCEVYNDNWVPYSPCLVGLYYA